MAERRSGGVAVTLTPLLLALLASCSGGERAGGDPDGGTDATARSATPLGAVAMKPAKATLGGVVQKGPFASGSAMQILPVDKAGVTTGKEFVATTSDALGDYSATFAYAGGVDVQTEGSYWNEISGQASSAKVTLHALVDIPTGGAVTANVNVVTHMARPRAIALMAGGAKLVAAEAQAETELVAALGLGGSGFVPGAAGIAMNELGPDAPANAYLLGLSATLIEVVLAQEASVDAGTSSFDTDLQELIDTIGSDLSTSGTLPPSFQTEILAAQKTVDVDHVLFAMGAFAASQGSAATAPDIDRVLDSDGDGYVNAVDTCPLVANPEQSSIPAGVVCSATRHITATTLPGAPSYRPLVADFTGSGHAGVLVVVGGAASLFVGDGKGHFAAPASVTLPSSFAPLVASDVDKDGKVDLVGSTGWSAGNGAGKFGAVSAFPGGLSAPIAVGDFNGDGMLDVAAWSAGGVSALLATAPGVFAAPVVTAVTGMTSPIAMTSSDVNSDGRADVVVTNASTSASLLGQKKGGLSSTWMSRSFGGAITGAFVADFDGNGKLDVGLAQSGTGAFTVAYGNGLGGFGAPVTFTEGKGTLGVGDFNSDGKADLWIGAAASSTLLPSAGTSFGAGQTLPLTSGNHYLILTPDLNGDGTPDVLVVNQLGAEPDAGTWALEAYVSGQGSADSTCPDRSCRGACVDAKSNFFNCGKCGDACALGATCSAGVCACPSVDSICDGQCVDLQSNVDNCGKCGHACSTGEDCTAGVCACPAGDSKCDGACVDLQSDPDHCGTCNHVCNASEGKTCNAGKCDCPSGGVLCGGVCSDETTDPNNCGKCGNICPTGATCSGGSCVCPSGQGACGGVCVSLDTTSNCGSCENACTIPGQICNGTSCVCPAFPGGEVCGGVCTDTSSDPANCGTCGNRCITNQTCHDGYCQCGFPNPEDNTLCNGVCVDLFTDPKNCSRCGEVCAPGVECAAFGELPCLCGGRNTCLAGSTCCPDGVCVDADAGCP